MIYTLTTNPGIDYYIYNSKDMIEGINRPESYEFIAAGKGVNVSHVLSNFNQKSTCVMFVGGFVGQFLIDETKKDPNIEVLPIYIDGISRINIKTRFNGKEVDLNTSGPVVTDENKQQLIDLFDIIKENDIVTINGSLQKGIGETVIELSKKIKALGGKLILDVPNFNLAQIVESCPYIIKPNIEELQVLLNTNKDYPEIIEDAKEQLCSKGINLLLSLGSKGSCYISADAVIEVACPKIDHVVNTVGAGDSLLAAFVFGLANNKPLEECLRIASATGSAAVSTDYLPTKDLVDSLLPQTSTKVIE